MPWSSYVPPGHVDEISEGQAVALAVACLGAAYAWHATCGRHASTLKEWRAAATLLDLAGIPVPFTPPPESPPGWEKQTVKWPTGKERRR